MATNIILTDITNDDGTGVFDKLMVAVNTQIESQYLNNRITGSDYANVYLGGMQAVLQQSMQFALQKQLTEAQVDDVIAGTALKNKQTEIAEVERLSKTYEKDTLLVDQHNTSLKQQLILDTEEEIKQYEVDYLLPEQLNKIQEEIDLLQSQDLVAYTERVIKDKQAAKLGLDNVMKNAEADRATDSQSIYTPKYQG